MLVLIWYVAETPEFYIAIVEKLDGKTLDWMEKVGDEQYRS